jgi:hypothetical protein
VSTLRVDVLSLLISAILGASGAEFWVSSIEKSMFVVKSSIIAMAASGDLNNGGGGGDRQRMFPKTDTLT